MKQSQTQKIRQWLLHGKTITQIQAYGKFGTICLHSRINELRKRGYDIITDMVKVKSRYGIARVARYKLARPR